MHAELVVAYHQNKDLTPLEELIFLFIPMESVEGIKEGIEIVTGTTEACPITLNVCQFIEMNW